MIKFILGESRRLEFEISHVDGEYFEILEAKYELLYGNEIIETGDMIISDHIISTQFTPEMRGFYLIKILYTIGNSTRAAQYHIDVD